ncbi:MAG: SDR family NAD(P)-dependent oxidoreductase [Actinomycetota bacterium]
MRRTVVVTGASGFIGKHIVKELLDHGDAVRGSVRSDAKADETRAAVGPDGLDRLSFVQLDLTSDDGWDDALAGADALLHTASPFPLGEPNDPEEIIRPAVDGTLRAMRAAHAAGVDRVVVTSSCVAIYGDRLRPGQTVLDETNWSPTGGPETGAYDDSKTLAERAAWDFVRDEAPEIVLSTVNPGVVLGVPLDEAYGTSLSLVERVYSGADPMLPDVSFPVVDVEDVAAMHRRVLEVDAAGGQRFPAAAGALTMIEMAEILNAEVSGSAAKARKAPSFLVRLMARFNADMRSIAPRLGRSGLVSGANAARLLGTEFVPAHEALLKSARFIAAQG